MTGVKKWNLRTRRGINIKHMPVVCIESIMRIGHWELKSGEEGWNRQTVQTQTQALEASNSSDATIF